MSEKSIIENAPSNQKIRDISNYLKESVIVPAEEERARILREANLERDSIISSAERKAKEIIDEAHKKAAHEKMTLESTLRISSRQAIDALKHSIINNILANSVLEPLKAALSNEDVVKDILKEIVLSYISKGSSDEIEISFSEELSKKIGSYVKSEVFEKTKGGINLGNEKVPNGFVVYFRNQQMLFDFSSESVADLLSNFVRPELKNYLFEK